MASKQQSLAATRIERLALAQVSPGPYSFIVELSYLHNMHVHHGEYYNIFRGENENFAVYFLEKCHISRKFRGILFISLQQQILQVCQNFLTKSIITTSIPIIHISHARSMVRNDALTSYQYHVTADQCLSIDLLQTPLADRF